MSVLRIVSDEAVARSEKILTPEALGFVAALHRRFGARRDQLLELRHQRRAQVRPLPVGRGWPLADIAG